jgi:hypothetical protein
MRLTRLISVRSYGWHRTLLESPGQAPQEQLHCLLLLQPPFMLRLWRASKRSSRLALPYGCQWRMWRGAGRCTYQQRACLTRTLRGTSSCGCSLSSRWASGRQTCARQSRFVVPVWQLFEGGMISPPLWQLRLSPSIFSVDFAGCNGTRAAGQHACEDCKEPVW